MKDSRLNILKRSDKKPHTGKSSARHSWKPEIARLKGAYAESTIRAYSADIDKYVSWCEVINKAPFPASAKLLSIFITMKQLAALQQLLKDGWQQ